MHIKFIKTGTGSAGAAKEYLLREHDSKGEIRESVQLLRGNPDQVTAVAESLEFKHTYRSAVIAWHKDDRPTPEQIEEVLNDFERVAFAGLEPNQYTYYAVWHGEADGSGHIHIITPRVELQTGKSMNIAPPGWQSTYDLIRDKYNTKYNWASPTEKSRQRLAVQGKIELHADTPRNQAKEMIDASVTVRIEVGLIRNRADVVAFLGEIGEITREGKDYISVKPKGFKKAIRLKGAAYEREFSIERVSKEVAEEKRAGSRRDIADRRKEAARIEQAIERTVEQRAKYNRGRYDYKTVQPQREADRGERRDRAAGEGVTPRYPQTAGGDQSRDRGDRSTAKADRQQEHTQKAALSDTDRDLNRGRVGDRIVEPWSVRNAPTPSDRRPSRRDTQAGRHQEEVRALQRDKGVRGRDHDDKKAESISDQRRRLGGNLERGELNDRIRARIAGDSQAAAREFQARAYQSIERIREEFKLNRERLQQADERSDADHQKARRHDREAEPVIKQVRERIGRDKDQLGSRAIRRIREAAGRFGQSLRRIGEVRQRLCGAVERCIDKAMSKVKEMQRQQRAKRSRSRGGRSW